MNDDPYIRDALEHFLGPFGESLKERYTKLQTTIPELTVGVKIFAGNSAS